MKTENENEKDISLEDDKVSKQPKKSFGRKV